jgi:hypothetical protein
LTPLQTSTNVHSSAKSELQSAVDRYGKCRGSLAASYGRWSKRARDASSQRLNFNLLRATPCDQVLIGEFQPVGNGLDTFLGAFSIFVATRCTGDSHRADAIAACGYDNSALHDDQS